MRRALVLVALVAIGTVGALGPGAGPAAGGESIPEEPCATVPTEENPCWGGSALNPGDHTEVDFGFIDLSGSFTRSPARTITVVLQAAPVSGSPGCSVDSEPFLDDQPPSDEGVSQGYEFAGTLSVPCNGTYLAGAKASTTDDAPDPIGPAPSPRPHDSATLDRTVQVAVPPPDVAGVDAVEGGDRAVTVSWLPVVPRPADHLGYMVLRTAANGNTVAYTLDDVTSFVDSNPPAAGGEVTYAVVARRPGATSGSEVQSATPGSKVVTVSEAPVDPGGTDGTTDGGTGSGGTGGTGTGATGGGGTGGSGGTVTPGGRPAAIQVPRVGTPSRNFFPALLAPPVDTGYSEELPYGDRQELPGDVASGPLDERLPGKGLAIPLATGLVLAVWALHLRFLARAARPQYYDNDDTIEVFILQ